MQKVGKLTSLNVRQQGNKVPSLPCHYFKHLAEYMYFSGKYMAILMFCILAIVIRFRTAFVEGIAKILMSREQRVLFYDNRGLM